MKTFIGKNTLYKILSIIKSDLTNNHNHDTRYYTEEEVNNLLQEQMKKHTFQHITLTQISNTKNEIGQRIITYDIGNIHDYREICVLVFIKDYAPLMTEILPVNINTHVVKTIYYIDQNNITWTGYIGILSGKLVMYTNPLSTNIDTNYLEIVNVLVKYK